MSVHIILLGCVYSGDFFFLSLSLSIKHYVNVEATEATGEMKTEKRIPRTSNQYGICDNVHAGSNGLFSHSQVYFIVTMNSGHTHTKHSQKRVTGGKEVGEGFTTFVVLKHPLSNGLAYKSCTVKE